MTTGSMILTAEQSNLNPSVTRKYVQIHLAKLKNTSGLGIYGLGPTKRVHMLVHIFGSRIRTIECGNTKLTRSEFEIVRQKVHSKYNGQYQLVEVGFQNWTKKPFDDVIF